MDPISVSALLGFVKNRKTKSFNEGIINVEKSVFGNGKVSFYILSKTSGEEEGAIFSYAEWEK